MLQYENIAKIKDIQKFVAPTTFQEIMSYVWYFLKVFLIVIIIYGFLRFAVFDLIGVRGQSMFPNYNSNPDANDIDSIYIDILTPNFSDYQRGDVVVLIAPEQCDKERALYIKRIIGLPGEKVAFENGDVFIINEEYPEGVKLDESSYLGAEFRTFKNPRIDTGLKYVENKLEANEYFFMGDNRPNSNDSRSCGPIKKNLILGKELFRLHPPEKQAFWKPVTYNISSQ